MTIVDADLEPIELTEQELTDLARAAIWGMWGMRVKRKAALYKASEYRDGKRGVPEVASGSSSEIRTLAEQSVQNVCGVVVDTFARGLSVVGYRSPAAKDDEPAWVWWQSQRLDARQEEVHDATLTYGDAYVSVLPPGEGKPAEAATWSPKNAVVEFDDPRRDAFPMRAILLRPAGKDWVGLYVDDMTVREFRLVKGPKGSAGQIDGMLGTATWVGEPWPHGATYNDEPVCPVVPFFNERSADDVPPRGEVLPLVVQQLAINSVNFDRLCASRFAAFQQKVVIGWAASATEQVKASTSKVWAFEDHPDDVKVDSLPATSPQAYSDLLREMKEQVALTAAIPLYQATGSLSNVSADTVAMVESAHQRKLALKRQSLGESWELVLYLGVTMSGGEPPDPGAEVQWRDTQARAFGAVVDGMVKLAQTGVPMVELLDLIPGMTQQRIDSIRQALVRSDGQALLAAIAATQQVTTEPPPAPTEV